MKYLYLVSLVIFLAIAFGLVACDQSSPTVVDREAQTPSTAQPTDTPTPIPTLSSEEILQVAAKATQQVIQGQPTEIRPYRSYPAPTGLPGFRRYYQMRCYPGCHSYGGTPAPTGVHP
jgi:hypothetical protein